MKKILLPFLLMLSIGNAYCQPLHFIKFIHIGIEQKPIGTLVISVEKSIIPTERGELDAMFGRCVQTDMNSFIVVRNFIKSSKLVLSKTSYIKESNFKIVDSNGSVFYISYKNTRQFATEIQTILKKKNLDAGVISAFDINFY